MDVTLSESKQHKSVVNLAEAEFAVALYMYLRLKSEISKD